jgi:hypothetical protein
VRPLARVRPLASFCLLGWVRRGMKKVVARLRQELLPCCFVGMLLCPYGEGMPATLTDSKQKLFMELSWTIICFFEKFPQRTGLIPSSRREEQGYS